MGVLCRRRARWSALSALLETRRLFRIVVLSRYNYFRWRAGND